MSYSVLVRVLSMRLHLGKVSKIMTRRVDKIIVECQTIRFVIYMRCETAETRIDMYVSSIVLSCAIANITFVRSRHRTRSARLFTMRSLVSFCYG